MMGLLKSRFARCGALWALYLLIALGVVACGGGSASDSKGNPPPATGTVSGVVIATGSGQPLSGVTVSAGARTTTTDAAGRYALTTVPAAPTVVKFDLAGYVRGVSSVTLAGGATVLANPQLTAVATSQQFNAGNATVVSVPNSTGQVSLPASGLVNPATGTAASGTVTAQVTPIDPAASPAAMPGNFQATGAAAPVTIESFGALDVMLRDGSGNTLNLASGKTATIRIPVATRSTAAPSSIPLYYFDETSGMWVEQGTATLQGVAPDQYYEGTVQHFTTWNADRPTETVFITGCMQQQNGQPAQGGTVETNGSNYSGAATVQTDAQGNFTVPMRRGTGVAALYGELAQQFTNVVQVGPTDVNQTLPNCLRVGAGNSAPAIVQQPASQAVPLGVCTVLRAQALGATPLQYQWHRDRSPIAGATNAWLSICPVTAADDNASFTVVVTNSLGSVTSNAAVLSVAPPAPPQILRQPADQQVQIGAQATFSVDAVAFGGTLSYQWQRGGTPIGGATGSSYTTPPTTLADDGAQFSVVVTSSTGASVTSSLAKLTVGQAAAPAITTQPQDTSVTVGQSATFTVVATGTPAPTYQWSRSGQPISGATGASYATPPTQLADDGALFTVTVSNTLGTVTSSAARLTVTQASGGSGYYLLGGGGPLTTISVNFANGAQEAPSQALLAVREDAPGNGAVTVEAGGATAVITLGAFEGTVNGDQLTNGRSRFAAYVKGSRFYKVDQVVASGMPTPQVVSSLASTDVCGNSGIADAPQVESSDWADATRGWLFLRAPGPDSACGNADDVWRAVRMNMSDMTAALTIGEPLAVIRAATGAFAGLIVRNGNQIQSLNADLGGATNLFTVDPASFVSAGNVFGSALPGLWIFVDGRTVYGVNLATPANRVPLATLATGETLVSHPVGDGTSGYFAINAAATGRVLRVTGALAPSDVTTLDAPAQYLAVTSSRVVASLASTPVRIVSAPKTGGTMQAVHTASVGETALTLLTSGENVYLSKLAIGIGALGSSTVIVRSDGTNAQALANTRVMHGISPTVVSVSQGGLSQSYAIVLADGVSAIGDFAGATVRAVEGATRNTLLTYGTFPATPSGTVFFMSAAPLQYGQTGLMSFFGMSSNSASDLYFMKSNTAGLQRVTTFVTAM